jgi:hypothetical protein
VVATYAIPILYVPVLMITHVVAFYLLLRPQPKAVRALAADAAAYGLRMSRMAAKSVTSGSSQTSYLSGVTMTGIRSAYRLSSLAKLQLTVMKEDVGRGGGDRIALPRHKDLHGNDLAPPPHFNCC